MSAGDSGTPLDRKLGIEAGHRVLVDNEVCAIDEVWSGLRLVVRKKYPAGWTGGALG